MGLFDGMDIREVLLECARGRINPTMRVIEEAFGTADFTNALVDAANVFMKRGFEGIDPRWKLVTSVTNRSNFRTNNLVDAEGMGKLDGPKIEGEPYYETKPSDTKETYTIARWGKLFGLFMEAMANDTMGVLKKKFTRWGAAVQNTLNYFRFYTLMDANPTMGDGTELFHADHSNLLTGSALSQTTLATAIATFMAQTDSAGEPINVYPRFLCVNPVLYDLAFRLVHSPAWAATGSTDAIVGTANSWKGRLEVIPCPEITSVTTTWYLLGDPNLYPVCEMGFYNGKTEPDIRFSGPDSESEFMRDTRQSRIRMIFGGANEDYRAQLKATA